MSAKNASLLRAHFRFTIHNHESLLYEGRKSVKIYILKMVPENFLSFFLDAPEQLEIHLNKK